jgi:hypothetical protein
MITDKEAVIEDLQLLIKMIENDDIIIAGYGVDKEVKVKESLDFDSEGGFEDTGKRTLTLKYAE